MTPVPSRVRRPLQVVLVVALLFVVPLLGFEGFEQRFGGPATQSVKVSPQQTPPPTSGQTGGGQRGGGSNRSDQFVGWPWWQDEAVKKELALKDMQVRTITRIYEDRVRQMKPLDDEYKKQFDELEKMSRERTVDVPTFTIQVTRVDALRAELSKTRTVMLYSIHKLLTPEQYLKFLEIRDRRRPGGRGGGDAR